MKRIISLTFSFFFFFPWIVSGPLGEGWAVAAPKHGVNNTQHVIDRVVRMPGDSDLRKRASALGLGIMNVMWEDTGRAAGSSLGPNISDLTLQIHRGGRSHLLPVIRYPNFSDKTADVPAESIWVKVGNEKGGELESVPLSLLLENLGDYLHDPEQLLGSGDLSAKRDTHYLVSAQHVFVPLSEQGKADFNPVIFNYQSAPENPAVLTLLVTREGTSVSVIENRPGDQTHQGWGQQLYFNKSGERTRFTAERLSAVVERIESGRATKADATANEPGSDMMLIVQVPLKHKSRGLLKGMENLDLFTGQVFPPSALPNSMVSGGLGTRGHGLGGGGAATSDVEAAVVGHGKTLGPFIETNGLKLERDERFPVRITVQFYKATSNGVVDADDLKAVHSDIKRVYDEADFVGSLVVPEGKRYRPTDWIKDDPNGGQWSPRINGYDWYFGWIR